MKKRCTSSYMLLAVGSSLLGNHDVRVVASVTSSSTSSCQNHTRLRIRDENDTIILQSDLDHKDDDDDDDDEDADVVLLRRRFLGKEVEDLVIKRWKETPKGLRKPPIYYSESYLPRANPDLRTDSAKAALAKEWGSWKFVDEKAAKRPGNDFYDAFPNRDVPYAKFPADKAWQTDIEYLKKFIPESIALLERSMEAVLAEYGRSPKYVPGKSLEERMEKFKLQVSGGFPSSSNAGGAMDQKSYEGFKRRLLHSILAEDSFNFAMGGHSAAAGHGNHFQQSYTLQIQRILEPVFARLGVKMTARNFGMGGLGTSQNALAAGDIYGRDVDVLMWDSQMTERDSSRRNIFALQGMLGSDRAPLQWNAGPSTIKDLMNVAGGDVACYGSGYAGGWPEVSENPKEFLSLPYEVQYLRCPKPLKYMTSCQAYNGTCWIDRSDFVWEGIDISHPGKSGGGAPGGRASWHPGNHVHQLHGRTFAFSTLQVLREIFLTWKEKPNYRWEDNEWHVTAYYQAIKKNLLDKASDFHKWCSAIQVSPKFCSFPAQGRTEFTPRNRPWATSLRSIMAGSGHAKGNEGNFNAYDPPDVYNPFVNPAEGYLDVLAIIENGVVPFRKNLARVRDSAENLLGPMFTDADSTGSKHNPQQIKGGKGWQIGVPGTDNCDGQYESFCKRNGGCMLSGHNDGRNGLLIDGYSGWVIFNLPNVEHGLIVAQIYHWTGYPPDNTKGWCSENNETPCKGRRSLLSNHTTTTTVPNNLTSSNITRTAAVVRSLGKRPSPPWCEDFRYEFALDGKITSWDKTQFYAHLVKSDRVVELVTMLDDDSWKAKKDTELAIRITGCGRTKPFSITHLYWI